MDADASVRAFLPSLEVKRQLKSLAVHCLSTSCRFSWLLTQAEPTQGGIRRIFLSLDHWKMEHGRPGGIEEENGK